MIEDQPIRRAYRLFADMLEYPCPGLNERVQEGVEAVSAVSQEASSRLEAFRAFVQETPASRLEEVYTGTFDLQVVCYPYVGYQLFGESYKRGAFMVGLREEYRAYGFSEGNELPDHLAVVLRFLAMLEDAGTVQELATMCLVPALDKMSQAFKEKEQPYGHVILALSLFLNELYPGAGAEGSSEVGRAITGGWPAAGGGEGLGGTDARPGRPGQASLATADGWPAPEGEACLATTKGWAGFPRCSAGACPPQGSGSGQATRPSSVDSGPTIKAPSNHHQGRPNNHAPSSTTRHDQAPSTTGG